MRQDEATPDILGRTAMAACRTRTRHLIVTLVMVRSHLEGEPA